MQGSCFRSSFWRCIGLNSCYLNCSVVERHRHAGVFNGLASSDLQDAVPICGLELLAIKAVGEAKAAAPAARAEFAQ